MKLTKGKVPKLLGKKKQSLKRYKKGKKQGNKRRTFRKRGSTIDLSKKTLKNTKFRMKGGDEEEGQETVINNGTMEQSLATLKEMTVGDLVSYLAQEIANKTLQTTLGPQTTEEALPTAALIQSKAGEGEKEEEQELTDTQTSSVVGEDELTPEQQAALNQQEESGELTPEQQEALLQQEEGGELTPEQQEALKQGEGGELTPEQQATMMEQQQQQEEGGELTPEQQEALKQGVGSELTPEQQRALQQEEGGELTSEQQEALKQGVGSELTPEQEQAALLVQQQEGAEESEIKEVPPVIESSTAKAEVPL
jgi:hypothetical protein